MWTALASSVLGIIDKVVPDPEQKAKAQLELLRMQQSGELETLKAQLSAIVAEAQSTDPWTSRARPSFLYVMYVLILASIPMGILSAFHPGVADAITKGMTGYLAAIPEPLYVLFGTGYLGYTAARQWGKVKGSDR
jgi:hypothetical protein